MLTFYETNKRTIHSALYVLIGVTFLWWLQTNYLVDKKPARLIETTITGTLVGGIYALVALGIVIINKASGVFNFAHGFMMLVGGLIFYSFLTAIEIATGAALMLALLTVLMAAATLGTLSPVVTLRGAREDGSVGLNLRVGLRFGARPVRTSLYALAAVILLTMGMTLGGSDWQLPHAFIGGICGSVLIGLVVERFTIRPLIGQPLFAAVMMTLAVSQVMRGFTQLVWGSDDRNVPIFANLASLNLPMPIRIDAKETLGGNIIIRTELLAAFVLALAAFAGFILFFRYTNVGLAMRATAENQRLAQSVGMRVRVILAVAWAIAALLAATGGVLQGGATSMSLLTIPLLALRAFPAVLLGGLESIGGALVGGIVIGLVEKWSTLLFPNQVGTELAPYVVLMIVLVIRPDGLFGQKRIERI